MACRVSHIDRVRPALRADTPRVIDLFQRVFDASEPPCPAARRQFFERLFFDNPWADPDCPSLVIDTAQGELAGFLGVVPRRMIAGNRSVRVATSSLFMVAPEHRSSFAGPKLLKRYFSGPQEISIADVSTAAGSRLWQGLGGSVSLAHRFAWVRPLRPAGCLCAALRRRPRMRALGTVASPLAAAADLVLRKVPGSPVAVTVPQESARQELDSEQVVSLQDQMLGSFELRPDLDASSFDWVCETLRRHTERGVLCRRAVRDHSGELLGWYVGYIKSGGTSRLLALAARRGLDEVLAHFVHEASQAGSLWVSGRADPFLLEAVDRLSGVFYRTGPQFMVHASEPRYVSAIRSGRAYLTDLDGEHALALV